MIGASEIRVCEVDHGCSIRNQFDTGIGYKVNVEGGQRREKA